MSELSKRSRALLDAAMGAESPGLDAKVRLRAQLQAQLGQAAAVHNDGGSQPHGAHSHGAAGPGAGAHGPVGAGAAGQAASSLVKPLLAAAPLKWAAASVLAVALGGGAAWRLNDARVTSARPTGDRSAPTTRLTPGEGLLEVAPPQDAASARPSPAAPSHLAATAGPRPQASPQGVVPAPAGLGRPTSASSSLAAPASTEGCDVERELELLRGAQLARRSGRAGVALSALDEVERACPRGAFLEEREVLRILSLCDAGDAAKAHELSDAFLRRVPRSVHLDQLLASCVGPSVKATQGK